MKNKYSSFELAIKCNLPHKEFKEIIHVFDEAYGIDYKIEVRNNIIHYLISKQELDNINNYLEHLLISFSTIGE